MKNRVLGLAAGLLASSLFAATPGWSQDVDERIKALEQELSQLKEQQIELKKEATAAAAKLPTFSYRPGNGMLIEAADKSWSFRASTEAHMRMLFESGRDEIGRTNGEIMGRRFRPFFYYCINNCFVETEIGLDLDGFGTGNAKNSTGEEVGSILQRGAIHLHFEDVNPWLPTFTTGMDISTSSAASASRQGSSDIGVQREYDLLSRNVGPNTGRSGNGITLTWNNKSLSGIGVPGRITRFQVGMASVSEGDDGLSSFTDRKDFTAYFGIQPFSQTKNKWLRGLLLETGAWFCNNAGTAGNTDNACHRFRIQDHGDAGRQVLFNSGTNSVGKGLFTWVQPGISWTVGPYRIRGVWGRARAEDRGGDPGRKKGNGFLIGNDLFIWSPKGFLTGSPTTPGSILIGYSFERNDISVGCNGNTGISCAALGGHLGEFHRNRIILNQWGIAYFFGPRMSILGNLLWYDASNLPTETQENLGIRSTGVAGRGGDWVDGSITLRVNF